MMKNLGNVWVVIPAFNEEAVIGNTVEGVLEHFPNVVVVDDHSFDKTEEIAWNVGATVCRHPINLGQGAALQTGIRYALQQQAEIIVTFDADGQHNVEDATAMVSSLLQQGCDVVLASRFLGTAPGISSRKRLLLKLATAYTRLSTGLAITDTHNGLRVLSRSAAEKITIRQNRMAHASEILDRIADLKLSFIEMPCDLVYTEYSKMKGQKMSGSLSILSDLYVRKLYK